MIDYQLLGKTIFKGIAILLCLSIIGGITLFINTYIEKKDGYKDIRNKVETFNSVCINNVKGLISIEICQNTNECFKKGNVIAYRKSKIHNKTQAIYFIPYDPKMVCNKDDSDMIINGLNNIKNDFNILIK